MFEHGFVRVFLVHTIHSSHFDCLYSNVAFDCIWLVDVRDHRYMPIHVAVLHRIDRTSYNYVFFQSKAKVDWFRFVLSLGYIIRAYLLDLSNRPMKFKNVFPLQRIRT
jgi:hypothetical protein